MDYPERLIPAEPLIFDTHAHYDDEKFDEMRDELLGAFPSHGVCGVITCGCDGKSSRAALALAEQYDFVYAAVGLHPENIDGKTSLGEIEMLAKHSKCVAIGEIGLDYYWDKEHHEAQKAIFTQQMLLANRRGLPVIVHDRDAHADTLSLLQQYRPRGVVHCYSGSPETAEELLKLGLYLGIGGVITFKNAKRLPEVVQMIPDDRFLLETDCPYLAPEPFRGKTCHSGMITLTAEKVAEIRGTTPAEILRRSRENARALFGV